jgi:dTDP-4-dehydrorhamnose reductase
VSGTSRRKNTDKYYLDLSSNNFDILNKIQTKNLYIVAGITGFKECRENKYLAQIVNLESPFKIAQIFANKGANVYFLSSTAAASKSELQGDYGRLKAQAEKLIMMLGDRAKIIRLSKVIAPDFPLFTSWITSLIDKQSITAYQDLCFSPIALSTVVSTIIKISDLDLPNNLFQLSGKENINYYQAALFFAKKLSKDASLVIKGSAESAGIPSEDIVDKRSVDEFGSIASEIFTPPDPYAVLNEFLQMFLKNQNLINNLLK